MLVCWLLRLRRYDTRLVVLATADVRPKVVKVGVPISDNEALAPQGSGQGGTGSAVCAGSLGDGRYNERGVVVYRGPV